MPSTHGVIRALAVMRAGRYPLPGVLIGVVGLCTRGCVYRPWLLEFSDKDLACFLRQLPNGDSVMAITLGYVALGKSKESLELARDQQLVQLPLYERWGPFFGPAYLGWSFILWLRGDDPAGTIYLKKKHTVTSETFRQRSCAVIGDGFVASPIALIRTLFTICGMRSSSGRARN